MFPLYTVHTGQYTRVSGSHDILDTDSMFTVYNAFIQCRQNYSSELKLNREFEDQRSTSVLILLIFLQ